MKGFAFLLLAFILHNVLLDVSFYPNNIEGFEYYDKESWIVNGIKCLLGILYEPIVGPLWFAFALFWAFVFMAFIAKFMQKVGIYNHWNMVIASFAICMLSCIINNYSPFKTPIIIGSSLSAIILVYIGYLLKNKYKNSFYNKKAFILCVLVIISYTYTTGLDNDLISLLGNKYPDPITMIVGALCGTYILCYIGKKMQRSKIGAFLSLCGKESFYLMAIHMVFVRSLGLLLSRIDILEIHINGWMVCPNLIGFVIIFTMSVFLSLTFCKLIHGFFPKTQYNI